VPRPRRVDIDARQFVSGTSAAIEQIRRDAEARMIQVGDETTAKVRSEWPVGEARTRRKTVGQHTRDGITGTHRHTKRGRLVYEIRVPFPGGFVEFGTRHVHRRPILRKSMAEARRKLGT
jgi:HK97 gp10 family phage protein